MEFKIFKFYIDYLYIYMGIGDWGLGFLFFLYFEESDRDLNYL